MKGVYFQMLDFKGKMPDNYSFTDAGYTSNLMEEAKEFLQNNGYESTEKALEELGFPMVTLRTNSGGLHIAVNNVEGRESHIFYNQLFPESADFFNRAHEEAHAASNLGLRRDLERMIGVQNLERLSEEDFCDQAGIYVLRKKGLEVPQGFKESFAKRLIIASNNLC